MSYLPRMSKTYKEPQQIQLEEIEMSTSNFTLKPASSLLAEGTHNPQVALKHYRYLPHPLPVLPGPSLFDEAEENELQREASRLKRSKRKTESQSKVNLDSSEILVPELKEAALSYVTPGELSGKSLSRPMSKKSVKGNKSHSGRKKSMKYVKKEKSSEIEVNVCMVGDTAASYSTVQGERENREETLNYELLSKDEISLNVRDKSYMLIRIVDQDFSLTVQTPKDNTTKLPEKETSEIMAKEPVNRSIQCTIFGSTEKKFVIPPVIHSLLRALALLLRELHREDVLSSVSKERRTLMTQIQLILGDLCNQKVENEYGFDVTYSDSKRFEKIFGDLQKYMKDIYGDKEEYIDKMEDLKKVFVDLKRKEMEVDILTSKLKDMQGQTQLELVLKESDLRNPEITLQNKRLESEQLLAEIEFSCRELLNYQKTLAEIDWDIRNSQDQIACLKKSASKSKSEVLGRRGSLHKFSSDITAKGSKSKESDVRAKKKT